MNKDNNFCPVVRRKLLRHYQQIVAQCNFPLSSFLKGSFIYSLCLACKSDSQTIMLPWKLLEKLAIHLLYYVNSQYSTSNGVPFMTEKNITKLPLPFFNDDYRVMAFNLVIF